MNTNNLDISRIEIEERERTFMLKVYNWMGIALLITAFVAYFVSQSTDFVYTLASNSFLFYGLIIAELGLVIYLSARIKKMSASTATLAFIIYSVLNGLTFSVILLAYTGASISSAFFTTSGMFAFMSAYGYFTKKDLTAWGSFFMMGLFGIIIASVINIFLGSSTVYWLVTYLGVFIFVGLTAYDTQKIKKMGSIIITDNGSSEIEQKGAIMGALTLYLDFINLFLMLLRIFGKND